LADNQPNVHTFVERLLDGMTWAEAMILSMPIDGYKAFPIGDPLLRALRGVKKTPRTCHAAALQ
jgi:hypothetical protein